MDELRLVSGTTAEDPRGEAPADVLASVASAEAVPSDEELERSCVHHWLLGEPASGRIIVRVLAVDGERVKLGIEAPSTVGVLREELVQQVAGANREAAQNGQGEQLVRRLRSLDAPVARPNRGTDGTPRAG